MKFGSSTNIGLVRKHNEDNLVINEEINLVAVADGMGGHQAGEVASSLAVRALEGTLLARKDLLEDNPQEALNIAVEVANNKIYETASGNSLQKGMGTTITAAIIKDQKAFLAHVGDSRGYLIHNKAIRQVTIDHSLVNELVKNGGLTEEEADQHPQKNVLTRALGTSPEVQVDLYVEDMTKGDMLVLCSDGLSNLVHRDEINEIADVHKNPGKLAGILVDKAIERGGYDNVTVVVCQV